MNTTTRKLWALFCPGVLILSLPFWLGACSTGRVVHEQFRGVNMAYADSLNEQMLLNIARLDNGHPAYYLAIGTINNRYTFTSQTSAGTTVASTDSRTVTDSKSQTVSGGSIFTLIGKTVAAVGSTVLGGSFSQQLTGTATPDFQFIPLNNEQVAQQVLKPIPTDVFSALYLQDYPIDQLMRVLIERVETTLPGGKELVLINSPTRGTVEDYPRFLRACAILRELQRTGNLLLETKVEFERGAGHAEGSASGEPERGARANNGPAAAASIATPTFFLRASQTNTLLEQFASSRDFDLEAATNVVALLSQGITIKTEASNRGQGTTRLVLRSFDRAMEAVASEQNSYSFLLTNADFNSVVPAIERRPILETVWNSKVRQKMWTTNETLRLEAPLVKVRYAGKNYQITDPMLQPLDPRAEWNRNVFRLLVALNSQVTVDISKFQRQVIQLQN